MIIQLNPDKKWISKSVGVIQEVALMVPWRKSIRAETKNALFPSRWLHTRNSLFRLEFCFFYKKKKKKNHLRSSYYIALQQNNRASFSFSIYNTKCVQYIGKHFFITEIGFRLLLGSLLLNISIETWINRNETWDTLYTTKPRWRVLSPLLFFLVSLCNMKIREKNFVCILFDINV